MSTAPKHPRPFRSHPEWRTVTIPLPERKLAPPVRAVLETARTWGALILGSFRIEVLTVSPTVIEFRVGPRGIDVVSTYVHEFKPSIGWTNHDGTIEFDHIDRGNFESMLRKIVEAALRIRTEDAKIERPE